MNTAKSLEELVRPSLAIGTKDVIGFDLGHGDTSIVRIPATGGNYQPLEVIKNLKLIPTVVGIREKVKALVVGKDAFRPGVTNIQQQFKDADVGNQQVADPLRSFIDGVMSGLRNNNSTIPFDATTLVVFGCPSAWSDEHRLNYGRLFAEQLNGMQAMLVAESRAAFITMKEAGQLDQNQIRTPILIVDFGSSTTDFTFVVDLEPAELPIGKEYPLGASCIEEQLLDITLGKLQPELVSDIKDWLNTHSSERHRTIWKFREAKEEFFSSEASYRETGDPVPISVTYYPNEGGRLKLEIDLTPTDFDAAINIPLSKLGASPISWRARLELDLEAASQEIRDNIGGLPRIVILTGGAARMDFVEEIAKKVFPGPTAVRRAPEPEHAIAVGLAHAGALRYRTQAFLNEIDKVITSGKVQNVIRNHMNSFAKAMADVVATDATKRFILPEFLAWQKSESGKLKAIAERISTSMETWQRSKDGQQKILSALVPWYTQISKELHDITAAICKKYNLDAGDLDIPKTVFDPKRPKSPTDPDEVLFGTARVVMTAVLATMSFVTGAILFGTGTAIFAPTGHFAPILAGVFLWLLGEGFKDWAIERLMNSHIPGWQRRLYPEFLLRKNLRGRAAETEKDIHTEITRSILGGYDTWDPHKNTKEQKAKENQAEIVNKLAVGIDSALRERADEASILIS